MCTGWYWASWVWCCTPIVLLLWGRVVWRQHLEVSGCSPRSILGLCPGWWAAILNVYTGPEKWAFESLVPQPELSPTLHAWDVRSGASWLQRKVSGCWVLDTPGGGNPWSKATLAHSCVGWGLARQDCCLLSVVTGSDVTELARQVFIFLSSHPGLWGHLSFVGPSWSPPTPLQELPGHTAPEGGWREGSPWSRQAHAEATCCVFLSGFCTLLVDSRDPCSHPSPALQCVTMLSFSHGRWGLELGSSCLRRSKQCPHCAITQL